MGEAGTYWTDAGPIGAVRPRGSSASRQHKAFGFDDLARWNAQIGALYGGTGQAGFFGHLYTTLGSWLEFDTMVVFRHAPCGRVEPVFHALTGMREQMIVHDYAAGGHRCSPFLPRLVAETADDLLHMKPLRGTRRFAEYFNDYYGLTGIRDEIGFAAQGEEGWVVARLLRGREDGDFTCDEVQFCEAIRPVVLNLMSRHMARRAGDPSVPDPEAHVRALGKEGLSRREMEIVAMLLQGHSSVSIALNLAIAAGTVKNHRKNIYRKLAISSQAELFSRVFAKTPDRRARRATDMAGTSTASMSCGFGV